MRRFRFTIAMLMLIGCLPIAPRLHAISAKQLPPYYRKWLEEDVTYIINQQEKAEFLQLKTDVERDKFIDEFWRSRNPDPHSEINPFKEEHYRRLAYVNEHFGDARYNDGWRTDMGRVYITLGPPTQRSRHPIGISTRPMEMWFYQSRSPALPPYFNVVFFERSAGEPMVLYSPRENGPTAIVTNDEHDDAKALKTIDKSLGAEITHAMVSLLPDEPIDIDDPKPSMESDILLAEIRNLPDQKLEKQRILEQRRAAEEVTTSIFLGAPRVELETAVLRDAQGQATVNFLLRNAQPDPHIVGTLPDKRTGYSLTLVTRVITSDGKPVYQQQDDLTGAVSQAGADAARQRIFAAEGRLPLAPGSYEVESTLTNRLTHEASRTRKTVVVPAAGQDGLGISDLIAYRPPSPLEDPGGQLPFTLSRVRFAPRGPQIVTLKVGERLPLFYQIWFPQSDVTASADPATQKKVHVHYVVGSVASTAGGALDDEDEDVPVKNLDAAGNLLSGHTLDTSKLSQGTYRLVVRVTEPGTTRAAFASMSIHVLPESMPVDMWTAYGPEALHPAWQDDLLRGIAAEALGNTTEAAACYRRALEKNAGAVDAQSRLNQLSKKTPPHAPGTE